MCLKSVVLLLFIPYVICVNHLSLDKPVMEGLSVQIHWTHPKPGELEMLSEAGFKFVRMNLNWADTEKVKGVYNFSDYEYLYDALKKHNMFGYSHLAYDNPIHEHVSTEEGRNAYVKWASSAIQHLKGRGVIWEIWNEPNVGIFWKGPTNATAYCKMALETMKVVRKETPNEIVVGPATYDIPLTNECLQMGLGEYWDGISVHPYRKSNPETVTESYAVIRRNIEKNEPKGKHLPLMCGEWGYSSAYKDFNDTIQAKYLQREVLVNIMENVVISNWYDWHDDGTNKTDAEHHFGIVHYEYNEKKSPVYEPKESYLAVKTMTTQLKGFKFSKRIHTNDTNDYVLLFHNEKNELRLTVWSTKSNEHNINIPSDKCDFEVIHYKGSPVEKAESSGGSVVLKINDSVEFIIVKCSENKALKNAPEFH